MHCAVRGDAAAYRVFTLLACLHKFPIAGDVQHGPPSWLQREVRSFARAEKIHETPPRNFGTRRRWCWAQLPTPAAAKADPVPTHERLGPDDCENLQD
jgi:hypothetical protein